MDNACTSFETKHFANYDIWTKNVGVPAREKSGDLKKRLKDLLLFYLVYAEIHDLRNNKGGKKEGSFCRSAEPCLSLRSSKVKFWGL